MTISVTSLNRYPIKSCRGESLDHAVVNARGFAGDRAFLIVDADGSYLTQRDIPRICLIVPTVRDTCLEATAPGMEPLAITVRKSGAAREVTIWEDRCWAIDQGDEAAEWLERFLGVPARLVRQADDDVRQVDQDHAPRPTDQVHFGDGYPFLLLSRATLDDLNRRMEAPLPVDRFRPNIVVDGCDAYTEDRWSEIRIGALTFDVVKSCSRCAITQIDQASGVQGKEPLRTLAGYRMTPEKKMLLGRYLIHRTPGVIQIGDAIEVLR
ncbi:MAG: MOSC domain-containing protein [Dehalococcoidia bacterium]